VHTFAVIEKSLLHRKKTFSGGKFNFSGLSTFIGLAGIPLDSPTIVFQEAKFNLKEYSDPLDEPWKIVGTKYPSLVGFDRDVINGRALGTSKG
jgi:hypothetical protein